MGYSDTAWSERLGKRRAADAARRRRPSGPLPPPRHDRETFALSMEPLGPRRGAL